MAPNVDADSLAATRASVSAATDALLAAVRPYLDSPATDDERVDQAQRRAIIDATTKLLRAVEEPADHMIDAPGQIAQLTASQLFWQWGVYDAIPPDGSISKSRLASATETEEALLTRIAAVLVANGVLEQNSGGELSHTKWSKIFVKGNPIGYAYNMTWENAFVPFASYPPYFEKYGRKEPQTINHVPVTFAYGVPEYGFYEMLAHNPVRLQRFIKGMAPLEERMPIAGIYDFSWAVAKAEEDEASGRPVFVDIGGSKGQAIKAIHDEFPGLPLKRFILQDRQEVIEAAKALDDDIIQEVQKMVIDFHKEQPIKSAHIYWIRRCLHNYGDNIAINMLRIIAGSMADDSKLLIQEDVLETRPHHISAMLDFMMIGFGGKQRSVETWERLLAEAGLKITSISRDKGPWKTLSVVECAKI